MYGCRAISSDSIIGLRNRMRNCGSTLRNCHHVLFIETYLKSQKIITVNRLVYYGQSQHYYGQYIDRTVKPLQGLTYLRAHSLQKAESEARDSVSLLPCDAHTKRGITTLSRPSVRPSVTLIYRGRIGWTIVRN